MSPEKYVIGYDYGTNSCRALLMKMTCPDEIISAVYKYPSGNQGIISCPENPHVARQHPQDYIDGFIETTKSILTQAISAIKSFSPVQVKAVCFGTTGSTVIPVDSKCRPMCMSEAFKYNINALAWLWKDHSSTEEADKISRIALKIRPQYLKTCGGSYSSEWFWSKILHLKNVDSYLFEATYTFVELCDFLPATVTGITDPLLIKRSSCAAGHKALFSDEWGGLPDEDFLVQVDPSLASLKSHLYTKVFNSAEIAGYISAEISSLTGLLQNTIVTVGALDAHMGAVGSHINKNCMIKIMGTSTCDLLVSKKVKTIPGVSGIARDSIIPGFYGVEAGQSAVGDLFLWFVEKLVPEKFGKTTGEKFSTLSNLSKELKAGQTGLLSLDWNNGNRNILADMDLSGCILGQTLQTEAHEIYKALLEATAFGSLVIIRRLEEFGIKPDEIICCGGLTKNSGLMQIYANITNRKISIAESLNTCALGAAIFAAAAYSKRDIEGLQSEMTKPPATAYYPDPAEADVYKKLFTLYMRLHDQFGKRNSGISLFSIMKGLKSIQKESRDLSMERNLL